MTIVASLINRGIVWMAADSAGTESGGRSLYHRADPKIFRRDSYLFGYAGSYRMGQLLRFSLVLPTRPLPEDSDLLYEVICTDFVTRVRQCFKSGGFTSHQDGREQGGNFLVGVSGKVFEITSDFQVGEHYDPFAAIGSARDLALGSLLTSLDCKDPMVRLNWALGAAERFNSAVCRPFKMLFLPGEATEC